MKYVLYHRDTDGAFAAAAAYGVLGNTANYISVQYGEDFPISINDLTSIDEIYIVDFSYKRTILDEIHKKVFKLLVLDHHKTAKDELKGTPYSIFDMNKCGSTLAWEYFYPNKELPYAYKLAEDRDLFRYELKETDWFTDGVRSLDIFNIPELYKKLENHDEFLKEILTKGKILFNKKMLDIKSISNSYIKIDNTAVFNHRDTISDLSKYILNEKEDIQIVLCWFLTKETMCFSLRSKTGSDINVANIAKIYGGGGHKHAAGFNMTLIDGLKFLEEFYNIKSFNNYSN